MSRSAGISVWKQWVFKWALAIPSGLMSAVMLIGWQWPGTQFAGKTSRLKIGIDQVRSFPLTLMISSFYSLARKPLSTTTVLKKLAPRLQAGSFSTTKYVLKEFVPPTKSSVPEGVSNGPLQGIRVLDLTRVLAGPYCTMLLGDLGAEVIKIENPKSGDDTRAWGPPWASSLDAADTDQPESAYFLCVNRNKKSVTVNLKAESGKRIIHELVKNCDVLVENYLPGKLEKMGLGYEQLKEINPKLIYASITGEYRYSCLSNMKSDMRSLTSSH